MRGLTVIYMYHLYMYTNAFHYNDSKYSTLNNLKTVSVLFLVYIHFLF